LAVLSFDNTRGKTNKQCRFIDEKDALAVVDDKKMTVPISERGWRGDAGIQWIINFSQQFCRTA
jgi:hypothetical protein